MNENISIKDWSIEERPREKMIRNGARSIDSSELLAILLRSGSRDLSAVDLGRRILMRFGNNLTKLSRCSLNELTNIDGIGETKALSILAAFELSNRMNSEILEEAPRIYSSSTIVRIFSPMLKSLSHEECWIVYLNRANKMISKERLSIGGISSTVMDTKIILKRAVEKLASGLIIVHNHPSANPYPGEQDRIQTRNLKEAAALFDISILDHIIIAGEKHYSFADESEL